MSPSDETPYEVVNEQEVHLSEESEYSEMPKRRLKNSATDVSIPPIIAAEYAAVLKNSHNRDKDDDGSVSNANNDSEEEDERLPPVPSKTSVPESQSAEYYNLHGISSECTAPGPVLTKNNMHGNDQDNNEKKPDIPIIVEKEYSKERETPAIPSKPVPPERQSNNLNIDHPAVLTKIDNNHTTVTEEPDINKPTSVAVDNVEKTKTRDKPLSASPTTSFDVKIRYVCVDLFYFHLVFLNMCSFHLFKRDITSLILVLYVLYATINYTVIPMTRNISKFYMSCDVKIRYVCADSFLVHLVSEICVVFIHFKRALPV